MTRTIVFTGSLILLLVISLSFFSGLVATGNETKARANNAGVRVGPPWYPPDTTLIPENDSGQLIRYGRSLIVNTAFYLGPRGIVKSVSNGLNCQNCHLDAGTRGWGNNFAAVASLYPKFRARSGTAESIEKKINDCFERSMNGKPIDSAGREMQAMIAYMKWLGQTVERGIKPYGTGLQAVAYLPQAADPAKGRLVFTEKCQSCHGADGAGRLNPDGITYQYPPLWGKQSYNTGAGIYRLSKFAAFVKSNMPYGATRDNPLLTDEEAWHVAAYVNSQPRPGMDTPNDWPDINAKPIDHPFGPWPDGFSAMQHKYGPFGEIEEARRKSAD